MLKEAKAEEQERCWQIWPFMDNNEDPNAPLAALNNYLLLSDPFLVPLSKLRKTEGLFTACFCK